VILADTVDLVAVAGHVADAEKMNPEGDEGDHEVHDHREAVELDADGDGDVADRAPVVPIGLLGERGPRGSVCPEPAGQDLNAQDARNPDGRQGHVGRPRLSQPRPPESEDAEADQRDENAQGQCGLVLHEQLSVVSGQWLEIRVL
jgi:hypothetical protein